MFGALLFAAATAASKDPLFQFQGYIFTAAFVVGGFALLMGLSDGRFKPKPDQYMDGVIKAGVIATLFWGAVGMLVGVVLPHSSRSRASSTSPTSAS